MSDIHEVVSSILTSPTETQMNLPQQAKKAQQKRWQRYANAVDNS